MAEPCANPKCGLSIQPVRHNHRFCSYQCRRRYTRSTPEYRLYMRTYQKLPPARRSAAKHRKSPKCKASERKYLASAKFRATRKAYRQTAAYKASLRKYHRSAKAKAAAARYRQGATYAGRKAKERARLLTDPEYRACKNKAEMTRTRKQNAVKLLAQLARLAAELQSRGPAKPKSRH